MNMSADQVRLEFIKERINELECQIEHYHKLMLEIESRLAIV